MTSSKKVKKIKAWAIFDKETKALLRYERNGEYSIEPHKTPASRLHHTFMSIPITITYTLPAPTKR